MFSYLKALAARFLRRGSGDWPPFRPGDPYATVREPRKSGPGGRNTAVAIPEPEEIESVSARGRAG